MSLRTSVLQINWRIPSSSQHAKPALTISLGEAFRQDFFAVCHTSVYYSTNMPFYHIWSRECAKHKMVIHCKCPGLTGLEQSKYRRKKSFSIKGIIFDMTQSRRIKLVIACHSSFRLSNQIKDTWLAFCAVYIVSTHPEGQMMLFF